MLGDHDGAELPEWRRLWKEDRDRFETRALARIAALAGE
jgi:hypothetical protein